MVGVGRCRDQRRPAGVGLRRVVAVAPGLVDRRDRPPEAVAGLVAPRDDQRVGSVRVRAGEQPGVVGERAALPDATERRMLEMVPVALVMPQYCAAAVWSGVRIMSSPTRRL